MRHLRIVRDRSRSSAIGEYGRLSIDGEPFCATCEQPWNDNRLGASCIPEGAYRLIAFVSPAHGPTFVFHNPELGIYGTPSMIPAGQHGRSLCELHNANWPFQVQGCIAVGKRIVDIPPHGLGVDQSVKTFAALMRRLELEPELAAEILSA